jgi:transcriptional regulator with XRE-family HTH domain
VRPEELGLPSDRRRTPGIRREELAALAAVSPEYVKRLEQNRAHPSPQVISSLVKALRLSHLQHELLSLLAGFAPPYGETVPRRLTAGAERLLARMAHTPVAVFDAVWTLIAWNAPLKVLMNSLTEATGRESNLIWRHFHGISSGVVRGDEEVQRFEATVVADLRAATVRYPADQDVANLVSDLRALSPRFAALWERREDASYELGEKTVVHPVLGRLTLDCDVFTLQEGDLRVVVFTAEPGSPGAEKLEQVRKLGESLNA